MSGFQIRIASDDYQDPDFCWYEFYGSKTNLAVGNVVAMAEYFDIAFSTILFRERLTPGDTWYHWVRAVYNNGTDKSGLLILGAKVVTAMPTAEIADAAVTYAKIQNVSATDKVLGRSSAGAGVIQEIPCTAFGRATIGASLTLTNDNFFQIKSGAPALRTPAQALADLLAQFSGIGQLAFPATQIPSTNANTLDDFEEFTWTPALFDDGTTGLGYAAQNGTGVKIGAWVYARGRIALNARGGGSSSSGFFLKNLPYNLVSDNTGGSQHISVERVKSITNVVDGAVGNVFSQGFSANTTLFYLGNEAGNLVANSATATTFFEFLLVYKAST